MKKWSILILATLSLNSTMAQTAVEHIESTLDAMGGQAKWKSLEHIYMKHMGHKYWLEQSEKPDGPFITSYEQVEETRAVQSARLHRKETAYHFQAANGSNSELVLNGDLAMMQFGERKMPMSHQFRIGYDEWLRYAPEHLLLKALSASPRVEGEEMLDGIPHLIVNFIQDELEHRLFINQNTGLLTQAVIESHLPSDIFNYPWGKFETTIQYSLQWFYAGGFRYPAQWDIFKLGKPFRSITIVDINFNPEIAEDTFTIPEEVAKVFANRKPAKSINEIALNTGAIQEVAEGIYTIPGMWYVGAFEQKDGIIVIEGPISSGYNAQHLDFIRKKFPNKPIKAVISTSDAWPHLGGIREFAAQEIPIYAHSLTRETLHKVLEADHALSTDAHQETKHRPHFTWVSKPMSIEDDEVPAQLIPANGEGGERMVFIYFPKQKALYASDLLQFNSRSQKFFSQQYLTEVKAVVDRHGLDIDTVFAMHVSPMPWEKVIEAINQFSK